MSRLESAVRIVIEFIEAFNRHDTASLSRLINDDCVLESAHPAPDGEVYTGKEAVTGHFKAIFDESPEAKIEVEEIFGAANRCIARWRYDGAACAGERKAIRGVCIFQVKSGSICEIQEYVKGDTQQRPRSTTQT